MSGYNGTPKFKVGDVVTIKPDADRTRSGRWFKGTTWTIDRVEPQIHDCYYMMKNMIACSGIWESELEYGGISEDDYEYV